MYRTDGVFLASGFTDMWDGSLADFLDRDENGNPGSGTAEVWTGDASSYTSPGVIGTYVLGNGTEAAQIGLRNNAVWHSYGGHFRRGPDNSAHVYALSEVLTVAGTPPGNPYATWAVTNAPGQDPDDDFDGDGVSNSVEFVLGGLATTNDLDKLPAVTADGTNMTFTFVRDQDSVDASVSTVIEVGTDLVTWDTAPSPYAVPDTVTAGPPVAVVDNSDGTDTVTLTVAQAPDPKKFARLKVVITP